MAIRTSFSRLVYTSFMKLTYLSINIVDWFLLMEFSNANLYTSIGSLAEIGPARCPKFRYLPRYSIVLWPMSAIRVSSTFLKIPSFFSLYLSIFFISISLLYIVIINRFILFSISKMSFIFQENVSKF